MIGMFIGVIRIMDYFMEVSQQIRRTWTTWTSLLWEILVSKDTKRPAGNQEFKISTKAENDVIGHTYFYSSRRTLELKL